MTESTARKVNGRAVSVDTVFRFVNGILTLMVLAALGAGINVWADVQVIKANRFTANDALMMQADLRAEMPPAEWRERITGLELAVRDLERQIARLVDP